MLPETTKPTVLSSSEPAAAEGVERQHRQLDREIRDMVNTLTHHIAGVHRPGASQSHHDQPPHEADDGDEHGVRIITLAGNNSGATMRADLEDKPIHHPGGLSSLGDSQPADALGTYVNSNFQAVNNSIMLQSAYNTNDPGVHLDISDTFEQNAPKPDKHARKGKKKADKESFKSDHQSALSD